MRVRQGSSVVASELSGRVFSCSCASEGLHFGGPLQARAVGRRLAFALLVWAVECQLPPPSQYPSPKRSGPPQTSLFVAPCSPPRFTVPFEVSRLPDAALRQPTVFVVCCVRRNRPQWNYSSLLFPHLSNLYFSFSYPISPTIPASGLC